MSAYVVYAIIMLGAGIGIVMMAAPNARVGSAIGSPIKTITILWVVAIIAMSVVASGLYLSVRKG